MHHGDLGRGVREFMRMKDRMVIVELDSIAAGCPCPSCQHYAERIHSHYQRLVMAGASATGETGRSNRNLYQEGVRDTPQPLISL